MAVMNRLTLRACTLAALCGLVAGPAALAQTAGVSARTEATAPGARAEPPLRVEGYPFERRLLVAQSELVLNGIGLRAVAWIKGYAAALYLTRRATTVAEVLAEAGPKRLHLRMLLDVPAVEFTKAIRNGIARNTPAAEQAALSERVSAFDAMVLATGSVKKGDVVNLDFVPGQGMSFVLNGTARGAVIPGDDFYAAILRIFIGNKPVDPEMKTGLLGGPIG